MIADLIYQLRRRKEGAEQNQSNRSSAALTDGERGPRLGRFREKLVWIAQVALLWPCGLIVAALLLTQVGCASLYEWWVML